MTTFRDSAASRLTRHFFRRLLDFGVLSEVGVESLKRMLLGFAAVAFSLGLLLVRIFMARYGELAAMGSAEPYRQAVLADHAFLVALPMWIVAFVSVLIGHALFPDDTDFRVLMALPVTRRLIFATKLAALAIFAGLVMVAMHIALAPLFLLTSLGPWAEQAFLARVGAFLVASLAGSAFTFLAVTAVNGLLVMAAPPGSRLAASAALGSIMLGVLVLALPFVLRLPGYGREFAGGSPWLYLAPPFWFVGVERWLLGDATAFMTRLASIGALAVLVAVGSAVSSYAFLYRRFDRVILRPTPRPDRSFGRTGLFGRRRQVSRPVFAAIRAFTTTTLRRSVLHQGIVVALSSIAAGLVVNSLISADVAGWWQSGTASRRLVPSVIWAPFALMFAATLAVRVALSVPIEPGANWVFRMTEQDEARPDQLEAAARTVQRLGVIVPAVLMFPLQWLVLGWSAALVLIPTLACGWLLVEVLLKDWERIPFTCPYIPGKGFVPQALLTGFLSFVLFTTFGSALAMVSRTGHPLGFVLIGIVVLAVVVLGRRRHTLWRRVPLAFDDRLPNEVNPLKLSVD
jgi:hypothetical protein